MDMDIIIDNDITSSSIDNDIITNATTTITDIVNDDTMLIESLNEDIDVFKKSKKGRKSRQSIMVYQGSRGTPVKPIDVIIEENAITYEDVVVVDNAITYEDDIVVEDNAITYETAEEQQQSITTTITTTVMTTDEKQEKEEEEVIVGEEEQKETILSLVEEELIHQLNNVTINDNNDNNDKVEEKVSTTPIPSSSKKSKKTPKSLRKKNIKSESPIKTSPIKTSSSLVLPSNNISKNDNLQSKSLTLKSFSSPQIKKSSKSKVAKSTKSLTIPVTPKFKTNQRMGKKEIVVDKVEPKTTLVDYGPKVTMTTTIDAPKGPTIPQPFQFATDKRITTGPSAENIPSVAELAENFMKNARSNFVPKNACKQLTIANAPVLKADLRCKSQTRPKVLSKEEQDAKIMEEFNKTGFKARLIDKRIFQSHGELGVPKVTARPVTQPVAFSFNTDKRLGQPIKPVDMEATLKSTLSSRPFTSNVQKGPTVPVSPKLNVARGQRASSAPARRQNQKYEKPKDVPNYSSPPKLTKPTPFHLATESRGGHYRASLEEQVLRLKLEEEKQRDIHVAPVPKFNHPFQPKHTERKPTKPEEFHLQSVARHEQSVQKFETDIILEESKKSEFHARPIPSSVLNPTFKIEKDENHVPLVPKDVTFESEKRAAKRKEFDNSVAQQKKDLQQKKRLDDKLKADKENHELNILRRTSIADGGMMFKSQGILKQDLYPSKKTASVPLTTPISPKFISKMNRKID